MTLKQKESVSSYKWTICRYRGDYRHFVPDYRHFVQDYRHFVPNYRHFVPGRFPEALKNKALRGAGNCIRLIRLIRLITPEALCLRWASVLLKTGTQPPIMAATGREFLLQVMNLIGSRKKKGLRQGASKTQTGQDSHRLQGGLPAPIITRKGHD